MYKRVLKHLDIKHFVTLYNQNEDKTGLRSMYTAEEIAKRADEQSLKRIIENLTDDNAPILVYEARKALEKNQYRFK